MTSDDSFRLALTDDEVLAVAARHGRRWPCLLPTLLTEGPEDLLSAAQRGLRSLGVRNLYGANGRDNFTDDLLSICEPALDSGGPRIGTFIADQDLRLLTGFMTMAFYESLDGTWVSEVTSPLGVHYLRRHEAEDCLNRIQKLLEAGQSAKMTNESGSGEGERHFCAIGRPLDNPVRLVSATGGKLRGQTLRIEGASVTELDSLSLVESKAALNFLLELDEPNKNVAPKGFDTHGGILRDTSATGA